MLIARFDGKELVPYWTAQVTGAIAAAIILYVAVASGAGFAGVGGSATNGHGVASPQGLPLVSV